MNVHLESTLLPTYSQTNTGSNGAFNSTLGGSQTGNALNSESGFSYDTRSFAGLKFWDRVIFGLTLNYARSPKSRTAAADNDSLDQVFESYEYGPSVGFTSGRWRLLGTYLIGGRKAYSDKRAQADGTPTADFVLANHLRGGFQFVLGYGIELNPFIRVGPSLAYRRVSYKTQDYANHLNPTGNYTGNAFTTDALESGLLPMISIMIRLL